MSVNHYPHSDINILPRAHGEPYTLFVNNPSHFAPVMRLQDVEGQMGVSCFFSSRSEDGKASWLYYGEMRRHSWGIITRDVYRGLSVEEKAIVQQRVRGHWGVNVEIATKYLKAAAASLKAAAVARKRAATHRAAGEVSKAREMEKQAAALDIKAAQQSIPPPDDGWSPTPQQPHRPWGIDGESVEAAVADLEVSDILTIPWAVFKCVGYDEKKFLRWNGKRERRLEEEAKWAALSEVRTCPSLPS